MEKGQEKSATYLTLLVCYLNNTVSRRLVSYVLHGYNQLRMLD